MLAKYWKKIGLIILVIACLINIGCKIASKISFDDVITDIKSSFSVILKKKRQKIKTNNKKREVYLK